MDDIDFYRQKEQIEAIVTQVELTAMYFNGLIGEGLTRQESLTLTLAFVSGFLNVGNNAKGDKK